MEGTRRIDEWVEIQKLLPPDDVRLRLTTSPKTKKDEVRMTLEEFKVLSLINGERTLPDIIELSPVGEFVTCRSMYKLIVAGLVQSAGKLTPENQIVENEEDGDQNPMFNKYLSSFRNGFLIYFPGFDPGVDLAPTFDKFYAEILNIPAPVRMHTVMNALENMLSNQLEYVFYFLGVGVFRRAAGQVKKEITAPMAMKRELVKRYKIGDNLANSVKKADRVVKLVKGAS